VRNPTPPSIDRAELHALLDVWIDKALEDPDNDDYYIQGGGNAEYHRGGAALILVTARPECSIDPRMVLMGMMKMGQMLITRGAPDDAPITNSKDEVQPRAEERRAHFSDDPRKPSSN